MASTASRLNCSASGRRAGGSRPRARCRPARAEAGRGASPEDQAAAACAELGLPPESVALLGGEATSAGGVTDAGGESALERYMRLPVEQYGVILGEITRVDGGLFRLEVERLSFFGLWVEPAVFVTVDLEENADGTGTPAVVLHASRCTLAGSDAVEKMDLNRRFALRMRTQLSWPGAGTEDARIVADACLRIYCEVIGPFRLMPKSALEGTCNAVLRPVMRALLGAFTARLAADYARWSTDAEYRAERAAMGGEQVVPESAEPPR